MEITAVINGLKALKEPCSLKVHCRNKTLVRVGKGEWRARKYHKLWEKLNDIAANHSIEWSIVADNDNISLDKKCHQIKEKGFIDLNQLGEAKEYFDKFGVLL